MGATGSRAAFSQSWRGIHSRLVVSSRLRTGNQTWPRLRASASQPTRSKTARPGRLPRPGLFLIANDWASHPVENARRVGRSRDGCFCFRQRA